MNATRSAEDVDETLTAVADSRRRRVVRYLIDGADGETTVEELAAAVASGSPDDDGTRAVKTALHHNHLPKLDAAGVVEYDPADGTVQYRRDGGVEKLVRFVDEELR